MNKKELLQGLLFIVLLAVLIMIGGHIDYQFIEAGYIP